MALYQTDAVVIGARNWGEADKVMTFFTRERGLVRAAAYGCRRPRSPLAGAMQMFTVLELQAAEGQRLDSVRTATVKKHIKKLGEDLTAMAYGAFVAEFLREFLPENQPEPAMYERFLEILEAFETRNPRITALAAAYQLLGYTGLELHYDRCVHCGRVIEGDAFLDSNEGGALCPTCRTPAAQPYPASLRQLIGTLGTLDWASTAKLTLHGADVVAAEDLLLRYLQTITGRPLKSLAFIQQIAM